MIFRQNKKKWLIYPEDPSKQWWDLFVTIVLLISCIEAPLDVAFASDEPQSLLSNPLSLFLDIIFLLDIFVIFNSAFYTANLEIVESRKKIALNYLTGWFSVDVLAILPIDLILRGFGDVNSLSRVVRFGRLYKMVKLPRLLRVLKIIQHKNNLVSFLTQWSEWMKLGLGMERLMFFIIIFILMIHLSACLWIITATINSSTEENNYEGTWLHGFSTQDLTKSQLYAVSIYWSV